MTVVASHTQGQDTLTARLNRQQLAYLPDRPPLADPQPHQGF
jgi:hypothetical protein